MGRRTPITASRWSRRPRGVVLPVKARAGASRNAVLGVRDGRLLVAVTQAAEKGRANASIARLLAGSLGLRPSDVRLTAGATSPHKRFLLRGANAASVRQSVAACVAAAGG